MRFFSRLAAASAAALLAFSASSTFAQGFTFPLVNQTGLDSSQYTLYAMGFSYNSGLVMTSNGTFVSQTTGTVSSYAVGSGGVTSITIANGTAFQGGRLYFFVVPTGDPAPSVAYGTQPANPPATGVPPYAIVEITTPASGDGTVDVQTVDGFSFPITITMNGQTNVAGQQYGQPLNTPSVNRAAIFDAYNSFVTAEGTDATPYADLVYGAGTVAGQPGGILNPYAYLCAINTQNQFVNLGSSLRTVWDTDLGTLFAATGLRVQGSASGAADSPSIVTQSYTVTPVTQTYPDTTVSLPALKFVGETNSSKVFYVFSPIGLSYLTDDSGNAITGSIANQNTTPPNNTLTTLTLNAPVTGLTTGMYVIGAGLATTTDSSSRGIAVSTITAINGQVLTLDPPLQGAPPTANSQYQFCKVPYLTMFTTTGQMVFGNTGVFADNAVQYPGANNGNSTVLGSLENSLVSALNRGVAVNATALNPGTAGGSTTVWGNQQNWYPAGVTQNLFSLFMHQGTIGSDLIFFAPLGAENWLNARGNLMGSAYGFGFDENGGPVPPAPVGQPEVPSKFDQNVPQGTSMQITFGAWNGPTPTPAPTPAPQPTPSVKIDGKKTIKTSASTVKIKGKAVGQTLYVKYKAKPGKTVTKKVKIKTNGQWIFKFKPELDTTTLQFYTKDSNGAQSSKQKVKVIHETK